MCSNCYYLVKNMFLSRQILAGLSLNDGLSCLELNLCGNALGSAGAKVLECYIGGTQCIESLDISDNGEMIEFINILSANMAKSDS